MRDTLQTSHLNTDILSATFVVYVLFNGQFSFADGFVMLQRSITTGGNQSFLCLTFFFHHIVCIVAHLPFFHPTGNGQNPQPPESLRLPPCACPISIRQCPDGHEERVLLCRLQTGHGLPQGEVSTYINLLMITVSS